MGNTSNQFHRCFFCFSILPNSDCFVDRGYHWKHSRAQSRRGYSDSFWQTFLLWLSNRRWTVQWGSLQSQMDNGSSGSLHWLHHGSWHNRCLTICNLSLMQIKILGWLSLGISNQPKMANADMYTGWVTSTGQVVLLDTWSVDSTNQPYQDANRGGTSDISNIVGSEVFPYFCCLYLIWFSLHRVEESLQFLSEETLTQEIPLVTRRLSTEICI